MPAVRADTICALARAWTLEESWSPSYLEALRQTYELMFDWGDEPRRARVGALLVRFLVEAEQLDEAAEILYACQPALRRLNLAITGNDLIAAGGRALPRAGQADKALSALASACRHPTPANTTCAWRRTCSRWPRPPPPSENGDLLGRGTRFDELLPLVPGMALPHAATRVRILCGLGRSRRLAAEVASSSRRRALGRPSVGPGPGRTPRARDRGSRGRLGPGVLRVPLRLARRAARHPERGNRPGQGELR